MPKTSDYSVKPFNTAESKESLPTWWAPASGRDGLVHQGKLKEGGNNTRMFIAFARTGMLSLFLSLLRSSDLEVEMLPSLQCIPGRDNGMSHPEKNPKSSSPHLGTLERPWIFEHPQRLSRYPDPREQCPC